MLDKEKCLALLQTSLNYVSANFGKSMGSYKPCALEKSNYWLLRGLAGVKSTVYFLTTKILREQGFGCTLIIPFAGINREQIFS